MPAAPDSAEHSVSRAEDWRRILEHTHNMKKLAQDGCWPELVALEAERGGLLRQFFSSPKQLGEMQALADDIREILEIDQFVIEAGRQERNRLAQTLVKLTQSRQAQQAYANNSE